MSMMTHILTVAKKIIQPVVLGIAMLFMTPVAGMLNAALRAPQPVQITSNETVVYKSAHAPIAFES
jgi:hypothetical protein